ncbi:MAG: TRAP transporter fused permease subunit [bacterium]|nr:TRAP transporter fused permease subunit [Gammaproteobacteria bacterium]HIL95534.1 TRAP transporter fused permease subunit [Pseudomonadales bacterium]
MNSSKPTPSRSLDSWFSALLVIATLLATLLALDSLRIFGDPILGSIILIETHYYYALFGLLLPFAFLLNPATTRFNLIPVDITLALLATGATLWLFAHSEDILDEGWEFEAPVNATYVSFLLWGLVLEALRRVAGISLFLLALMFSLYPLIADLVPDAVSGMASNISETAAYHVMSSESLLGLPFRAFANLVIGFLVFGVALQHTGGGRFFIDLAFSLLGKTRGGPAKVAIVASGLMGSMSGSVITNVLTTGQLTIPAMRNSGIHPKTAAAVEACASTGGVLLPPIMGSTAFVMATFLEVPYYQVALAAAVPALLYFFALFVQLDIYAARNNLKGLTADKLPSLIATLKDGWFYLGSFIVLVFLLLVMQREAFAPWLATLCLLILNQFSKQHRWQWPQLYEFVRSAGALLVELLVILSGVGLIVGALSFTGLSGTLVNELLFLAGGSTGILLLMGAATSFVLGIGMTVTAAYIFLAIILAPALIQGGLDPMGVHLFILYWGMLSFITPPVALGAFAAASIAETNPMSTGVTAMALGTVTYFIPFFFVLDPALVLDDDALSIFRSVMEVLFGTVIIAAAIQNYLTYVPQFLNGHLRGGLPVRIALATSGLLIALPSLTGIDLDVSNVKSLAMGIALLMLVLAWQAIQLRER